MFQDIFPVKAGRLAVKRDDCGGCGLVEVEHGRGRDDLENRRGRIGRPRRKVLVSDAPSLMIDESEDFTGVGIQRGEYPIVGVILLEDTRYGSLQAGINRVLHRRGVVAALTLDGNFFRIAVLVNLQPESPPDQGAIYPPDILAGPLACLDLLGREDQTGCEHHQRQQQPPDPGNPARGSLLGFLRGDSAHRPERRVSLASLISAAR